MKVIDFIKTIRDLEYKLTFELNQYNMAAAISLILGLIVSGFAFFQFRKTRAFKEEGNI